MQTSSWAQIVGLGVSPATSQASRSLMRIHRLVSTFTHPGIAAIATPFAGRSTRRILALTILDGTMTGGYARHCSFRASFTPLRYALSIQLASFWLTET